MSPRDCTYLNISPVGMIVCKGEDRSMAVERREGKSGFVIKADHGELEGDQLQILACNGLVDSSLLY